MGTPQDNRAFKQSRRLPFTMLSNLDQRAYALYGLSGINPAAELATNTIGALFRETLRGNLAGIPVGSVTQLGGTFLIDGEGIARYLRREPSTSVYPSNQEVLAAAKQVISKK